LKKVTGVEIPGNHIAKSQKNYLCLNKTQSLYPKVSHKIHPVQLPYHLADEKGLRNIPYLKK